ncbi:MAG: glycosyltransferase family 2 protein, partial [Betaproteobacteria bacterium]
MPATASGPSLTLGGSPDCTLIVPVYRNEENIPRLLERFAQLHRQVDGGIEVICVVDGSPDRSYELLEAGLVKATYPSRLLLLSRNFGSFAAIREGLKTAGGRYFAVMAADLQEPAELIVDSFAALQHDECDVALGTRISRADPWTTRLAAGLFWGLYRHLIQRELPPGGVDVFACNRAFREQLLAFQESHTSLVGQLLWLGFRRKLIPYARQPREHGRSAWKFRGKLKYLLDSIYSFSDLPIKIFVALGALGVLTSVVMGLVVLISRMTGGIDVPGYAATVIAVVFFSGLNMLGLGIIGSYVWRAYENTKSRPLAVVMRDKRFTPGAERN